MKNRKTVKGSLSVMAFVVAMAMSGLVLGQPPLVIDAQKQLQFAESYFARGEYYRAISEYERFIYFFPQNAGVPMARYQIGRCYLMGGRLEQAVQSFSSLVAEYPHTDLSMKSYLKMSECYVKLKEFSKAMGTLENLLKMTLDDDLRDEALYRRGWIYLEMEEWSQAEASFDQISPKNRGAYGLKALSEDLSQRESLRGKDPTAAGWLAVLPGAGHAYCERYQDALIAFLLNGAMIFAAYQAFDNDNEALGGVVSFFEIGLYGGNIYSAVNCAHKYNRKQKQDFLQYLKEHSKLEASTGAVGESRALAVSCKITF